MSTPTTLCGPATSSAPPKRRRTRPRPLLAAARAGRRWTPLQRRRRPCWRAWHACWSALPGDRAPNNTAAARRRRGTPRSRTTAPRRPTVTGGGKTREPASGRRRCSAQRSQGGTSVRRARRRAAAAARAAAAPASGRPRPARTRRSPTLRSTLDSWTLSALQAALAAGPSLCAATVPSAPPPECSRAGEGSGPAWIAPRRPGLCCPHRTATSVRSPTTSTGSFSTKRRPCRRRGIFARTQPPPRADHSSGKVAAGSPTQRRPLPVCWQGRWIVAVTGAGQLHGPRPPPKNGTRLRSTAPAPTLAPSPARPPQLRRSPPTWLWRARQTGGNRGFWTSPPSSATAWPKSLASQHYKPPLSPPPSGLGVGVGRARRAARGGPHALPHAGV